MKRLYLHLLFLTALLPTLVSCLGSDDNDFDLYEDTAVIGFVLGQMNATVHTTSSIGEDSTFRAYVDGTKVPIYIDHQNCRIYNVDSLPTGTDMEHITISITTKNENYAMWRSLTEDRLSYHSGEDSIDLSVPRELYVFNTSGSEFRKYEVVITKHRQEGDVFHWYRRTDNPVFAGLKGLRAATDRNTLYVAGTDGTATTLYYSALPAVAGWASFATTMPADAWQTLLVHNGKPHLTDGNGTLYIVDTDADGAPTQLLRHSVPALKTLIATDGDHLYGIDHQGHIIRTADAESYDSWTEEPLDDDNSLLPTQHITATLAPLNTDNGGGRLVVVGNLADDAQPSDTTATIWAKITGSDESHTTGSWLHCDGTHPAYSLPRLYGMCTIGYGTDIIALGGQPIGNTQTTALTHFLRSIDGGVSWKKDTRIPVPETMECSPTVFALTVDKDNYIYLICGGSGQVWRGRLNRMGWEEFLKEYR